MEAVYTDRALTPEQILSTLSALFPELSVYYWDISRDALPPGYDPDDPLHIMVHQDRYPGRKEFEYNLSVFGTPDRHEEERSIIIARALSRDHGIRVLTAFTHPEYPDDPYYDLIFEVGKVWLADDSDTSFADGAQGLVRLVREYSLPEYKWDGRACFIEDTDV